MITMADRAEIPTTTLVRLSGATERQVNHWYYKGVISPANAAHGSGVPRRWSADTIPVVAVLVQIQSATAGHQNSRGGGGSLSYPILIEIAQRAQRGYTDYDLSDTVTISWKAPT